MLLLLLHSLFHTFGFALATLLLRHRILTKQHAHLPAAPSTFLTCLSGGCWTTLLGHSPFSGVSPHLLVWTYLACRAMFTLPSVCGSLCLGQTFTPAHAAHCTYADDTLRVAPALPPLPLHHTRYHPISHTCWTRHKSKRLGLSQCLR